MMRREADMDLQKHLLRYNPDLPPFLPCELNWAGTVVRLLTAVPCGPVRVLPLRCERKTSYGRCGCWLRGRRSEVPAFIEWECPACECSGRITGWQNTRYDATAMAGMPPSGELRSMLFSETEYERLRRLLADGDSNCRRLLFAAEVRNNAIRLQGTPGEFIALRDLLLPEPAKPGRQQVDAWAELRARIDKELAAPLPAPPPRPTEQELLAAAAEIAAVHWPEPAALGPGDALRRIVACYNLETALPLARELGVSVVRLDELIGPLPLSAFVRPETTVAPEEFGEVPLLADIVLLLREVAEAEPLRATACGNLPRAFCRLLDGRLRAVPSYYQEYIEYRGGRVMNEHDVPTLSRLRHLVEAAGWLRRRKGAFALSAAGRKLLQRGPSADLYRVVLRTLAERLNWAENDRFPDFMPIQLSFPLTLFLLDRLGHEPRPAHAYAHLVGRAFPALAQEHESHYAHVSDFAQALSRTYIVRMCEWVLVPLGLIVFQGKRELLGPDERTIVRTPLFERLIRVPTREELIAEGWL